MARSQEHKAQTHERILAEAAGQVRASGLQGVSIAELMKAAGVTHGGFYRHFDSRDDLVAQAVDQAIQDGARHSAQHRGAADVAGFSRFYLSRAHRDGPERGCGIAALAGDMAHADAATRAVFTGGVRRMLDRLTALQSAETAEGTSTRAAQERALQLMSTLVGTLVLSRAVDDPALSDLILQVNRQRLCAAAQKNEPSGHD